MAHMVQQWFRWTKNAEILHRYSLVLYISTPAWTKAEKKCIFTDAYYRAPYLSIYLCMKDGYIMLFIYFPGVFPQEFMQYINVVVQPILRYVYVLGLWRYIGKKVLLQFF